MVPPLTQLPPSPSGAYSAPSLSAHPGPVVASGENVSLSCSSESTLDIFHLLKEGGADPPRHMELTTYLGMWQAVFTVGPVNASHGGTYRCYGSPSSYSFVWSHPSNPLHLEVTGVYREPSLSAQPGSLVLSGDNLTLQCHSEAGFDRFALSKDEGLTPPQSLHGQHNPDFPLGHVNQTHGGRYRCYSGHHLSYVWSAPSAPLDILIAGMYEKPSLSAQPGPSVSWGENVTLQCRSDFWLDSFHLCKEGTLAPPQQLCLQDTAAHFQANFTISPVTSDHEGSYRCYSSHSTFPYLLSLPSDPLELLVSGVYSAPSLSAHPGPAVALGGNVSLSCSSESPLDTFHLLKEGGADPARHMELRIYRRRGQVIFPVGPVNTSHGGTYRCYGSHSSYPYVWSLPSDPLHLMVTGVYWEPSLSAQPSSLVLSGDNPTLQCRSEAGFYRFALIKDEGLTSPQGLYGQHSPTFPLGHVNHIHGGQYRCYSGHNLSYAWSAPSAPLDILIPGMYKKHSLSVLPQPSVSGGQKVTLQCHSEIWLDIFHLSNEGALAPPQHLHLQDTAAPFQANITISLVTSDHEGTYRCYSSDKTSPYMLSLPNDPLELLVSEAADTISPSQNNSNAKKTSHTHDHTVENLIRMGVAALILLVLGILLFQARHSLRRPQDAARR
ncbi:leukocyte immunoglobulin-like receptor subfamily A member 2 [Diceros bicornis minor]|uniref:leukocyte immunoglobulin-like receptor subfamily A member 2 n=1 Tax=Diceros bicornis minor TaxID=77932 RepID=UPI0026EFFCAF|nr:leukocyte immunoglobulin-like receptor subfamily A member 2 [Diceros bicornis minor]